MERAAREAGLDVDKFKRCSALEARFARNTALKDAGEPVDDPLSLEELLELIDCREWMRDDPAVRRFLDAVSSPDAIAADEVDEYAGDLDLLDKIIRLLESQSFGIMIGPVLVALDSGEEQEVVVSQNPDGPPRVRVIEGEDNIEPPEVRRVGGSSRGWGHYRIKIKGRAAGSARIEVICGDKRETVRVTVR
jgi:hypothetical protein